MRDNRTYVVVVPGNTQADTCKFFNGDTCNILNNHCGLICNSKKCTLWLPHDTVIDFEAEGY